MKPGLNTGRFYPTPGSGKIRYLTPTDRKAIRESKEVDSSTSDSPLSATVLNKLQKRKSQGHKRMAKKKCRSSKFKPFSSTPNPASTVSKKEMKLHTSNWAPKSLSQAQWKRYDNLRRTLKFAPPLQINLDLFKKGESTSEFITTTSSTVPKNNHKPVAIENDENTPPATWEDDAPAEPCMPSSTTLCDGTKKVSKLFPIFEKASRNANIRSIMAQKPLKDQKVSKKLTSIEKSNSQYIIDAGQKKFGATQCSVCGMVFTASHPVDEQDHQRYHKRFLGIIKFPGWKYERVVASFMDGRIIKVTPSDQQYSVQKVVDILGIVDVDLGFQTPNIGFSLTKVAYLFISDQQKVAGCLIAEKIDTAFHLVPTMEGAPVGDYGDRLYCTSPTPVQTVCGISRIWTYAPLRRKKIATRLIDAVRASFVLGMCLSPSHVAFSDPTPDGRCFAMKYFGATNVLVYNLLQ